MCIALLGFNTQRTRSHFLYPLAPFRGTTSPALFDAKELEFRKLKSRFLFAQ